MTNLTAGNTGWIGLDYDPRLASTTPAPKGSIKITTTNASSTLWSATPSSSLDELVHACERLAAACLELRDALA